MTATGRTLAAAVTFEGLGLFSGEPQRLDVHPGETISAPSGCVIPPEPHTLHDVTSRELSAGPDGPTIPGRNTRLGHIDTVEHVVAALAGLGVTGAGFTANERGLGMLPPDPLHTFDEVPILDGSAEPFVDAFLEAGFTETKPVEPITPPTTIEITSEDGASSVTIEPAAAPRFRYELDYGPNAPIKPAVVEWAGDAESFINEIAPARTFCLAAEAEAMRALGLFRDLTPRDLLVIADDGRPIDNDLRFPDEPARHKLLDLIGDMALTGFGRPIHATITARRSGHRLHHLAARALAAAIAEAR